MGYSRKIKAIIFDLDGTLTVPVLDFDKIRKQMGLTLEDGPILEAMEKMTPAQRKRAEEILLENEQQALAKACLNEGVTETLARLRRRGIKIGILTRNTRANAHAIAEKFQLRFDHVVGREHQPVKPAPQAALRLCEQFGCEPCEVLFVGDYLHDLQCAKAAKTLAVLIRTHPRAEEFVQWADHQIEKIEEILELIDSNDKD